jgi:hypothetical protein
MASSFTTNKVLEKPGNGDYVDTWNVPVNGDLDIIDQAFGGTTSLNATGGSATLTDAQFRPLFINITGAISASVTYTIPSGKSGQWIVFNSTTDASGGPHSIVFASGGGGTSFAVPRSTRIHIVSDGTNVRKLAYTYEDASGNLNVTNDIIAGGDVQATTTVSAGTTMSDAIGNLREVPANSQTSSYTLQASDSGKFISITTGGVIVPQSVFSVGQTISIFNNSSSNQTITQGAGATLRLVGSTSTGDRTLASYGLATILCFSSNVFVVTGGGVS